ncbi:hypothetical protein Hanom_Chr08g00741311 [Helianthus anomalus]
MRAGLAVGRPRHLIPSLSGIADLEAGTHSLKPHKKGNGINKIIPQDYRFHLHPSNHHTVLLTVS